MKGSEQRNIFAAAQLVLEGEDKAQKSVVIKSPGHRLHGKTARVFHDFGDGRLNVQIRNSDKKGDFTNLTLKKGEYSLSESTEDESSLSETKVPKLTAAQEEELQQRFQKIIDDAFEKMGDPIEIAAFDYMTALVKRGLDKVKHSFKR